MADRDRSPPETSPGSSPQRPGRAEAREDRVRRLVAQATRGDREATDALVRMYQGELVGLAHARLGNTLHDLTESVDLVQSLWKDLLDNLGDFDDRGPGSFAAWLRTCLLNKIHTKRRYFAMQKRDARRVRRLGEGEDLPSPGHDPAPSTAAASEEEVARLLALLERLPPLQRRVLLLRLRDERPFSEIGAVLGRSEEAARKLYQRGLAALVPLLPREWRQAPG